MEQRNEHTDSLRKELAELTFHLFAIGINAYQHHRNLQTAEKDAKDFADVLVERYGFDKSNVDLLLGANATADAIDRRLRRYASELGPKDVLVMFYAGHGEYDEAYTDGTYLIPHDAGKDSTALWIDHEKVRRYFGSIKAKHILLISDSCFSGGALRWVNSEEPPQDYAYDDKAITRTSRQVMTSGGLETVQDRGFGGHSVFSHFLLRALQENQAPFLSTWEIFGRIKDGVAANAKQKPEFGVLENAGDEYGGLVFELETEPNEEYAPTRSSMEQTRDSTTETPKRVDASLSKGKSRKKVFLVWSGTVLSLLFLGFGATQFRSFKSWVTTSSISANPNAPNEEYRVITPAEEIPEDCPVGLSGGYVSYRSEVLACGGWNVEIVTDRDYRYESALFTKDGWLFRISPPSLRTGPVLEVSISIPE